MEVPPTVQLWSGIKKYMIYGRFEIPKGPREELIFIGSPSRRFEKTELLARARCALFILLAPLWFIDHEEIKGAPLQSVISTLSCDTHDSPSIPVMRSRHEATSAEFGYAHLLHLGSGGSTYTRKVHATREALLRDQG